MGLLTNIGQIMALILGMGSLFLLYTAIDCRNEARMSRDKDEFIFGGRLAIVAIALGIVSIAVYLRPDVAYAGVVLVALVAGTLGALVVGLLLLLLNSIFRAERINATGKGDDKFWEKF